MQNTQHGEFGSPELVTEARVARDKIKKNKKKAMKQDRARAEKLARAESGQVTRSVMLLTGPRDITPIQVWRLLAGLLLLYLYLNH